jgi:flagellar FliL protein
MSAVPAAASPADAVVAAVPKKSRKKLFVIVAAALLVLGIAGGGAVFVLKKKAAAAAAEAEESAGHGGEKVDRAHPPTFVPLDAFVVNLADKDADRYAQIGVTLEIDDAKFADQIKLYMPAIRNGVLMVLAHKTSRELLERSGKETLAAEILRAAVQPLGLEVEAPLKPEAAKPAPAEAKAKEAGDEVETEVEAEKPAAKPAPKRVAEHNPVRRVHFSNFIIQ